MNPSKNPNHDLQAMRAMMLSRGVTSDEMMDDPEFGLLLSPSAVRKLAAQSPDTAAKMELLQQVQQLSPIAT